MIDRQRLLNDLKPVLREIEADLRARCDEIPQIDAGLKTEYEQARAADRTGVTYEEWRADLITQVAVAWVLSCVFVRFLEDNDLISPPRISGPLHGAGTDAGLHRARDERETYFKTHPKQTDRDYLLAVFDDLAKLPGTKDVFGAHNPALAPAFRSWLSGDAAQKLIEFFQKIDADGSGEIIHDFTDPYRGSQGGGWDTRFLGDLYQDLSEAARKKYALLQTPIFVEEFILDRTLEPAIQEFGLTAQGGFKMIDPACGSGHFLLGAFARLLRRWRQREPGTSDRELILRALAGIHGVDLNPYAIAIARFRLLIAVLRECRITKLADAPAFVFNLACGDSLLHGAPGNEQQLLGFHELAHAYQGEDLPELQRILTPGRYHAVVANPPYITVKDKALNQAYRERYPEVCHMKYSLSVPFLQRLVDLTCPNGFTGQITANSFMKREFGKKLVESYLPKIDLTHVIDTSGAYIPGHGTPTVIVFGRGRAPLAPSMRIVMG
ncbi:MAG TPA: BREX-2 system adenine-specific DNA-methyltransferase PglX, partial [Tepidisphaeraceae bacterium]